VAPVVFAFGLWRAGVAGWWLPATSIFSVALFTVPGGGDSSAVMGAIVQIPTCIQFGVLLWIIRGRSARLAPAKEAPVHAGLAP
jgi:hypothetical protein